MDSLVDPRFISHTLTGGTARAVHCDDLMTTTADRKQEVYVETIQVMTSNVRLPTLRGSRTCSLGLCLPSQFPVNTFSNALVQLMSIDDRGSLPPQNSDEIF